MTNAMQDELGDLIVRHRLAPNQFVLDLNRCLTIPHDMELPLPWSLPSRLFRFPIEVSRPDDLGQRRLALRHPLLRDHPFVQKVAAILEVDIDVLDPAQGYGQWWHAVDLVSAGHWRELIATRHFTTDDDIARAVAFGLDYSPCDPERGQGYLSTAEAKELMRAIGRAEPASMRPVLLSFAAPVASKSEDGSERWPIHAGQPVDVAAAAWGRILGIEAGWFAYDRSGFLAWSAMGRQQYAAGDSATFTDTSGQGAFAF